jgi:Fe-S-cluster containining protein
VTGADIYRIEQSQQRDFWEFVCRWEDRDGAISAGVVPQFRFEDDPATPFVICLLHEPSATFPQTTKCRFLEEDAATPESPLGRARCGIYDSRPTACRVFPTKLSACGSLAVLHDVPASGRPADGSPAFQLCGRPWTPAEVDPIAAVQDLLVLQFELQFFRQVATLWNRDPGRWRDFPEFLRLVYSQRVQPIPHVEHEAGIIRFPQPQSDDDRDSLAA